MHLKRVRGITLLATKHTKNKNPLLLSLVVFKLEHRNNIAARSSLTWKICFIHLSPFFFDLPFCALAYFSRYLNYVVRYVRSRLYFFTQEIVLRSCCFSASTQIDVIRTYDGYSHSRKSCILAKGKEHQPFPLSFGNIEDAHQHKASWLKTRFDEKCIWFWLEKHIEI